MGRLSKLFKEDNQIFSLKNKIEFLELILKTLFFLFKKLKIFQLLSVTADWFVIIKKKLSINRVLRKKIRNP